MSRWTYFSPLWLGALLVLALNELVRGALAAWSPGAQWAVILGGAVVFGLHCQVLMLGAQGAFAQVLPVPGGRSVRGGPAMAAGWLLIAWFGLSIVTGMLAYKQAWGAVLVLGVSSAAALIGALVIYIWQIPAAEADFEG